jgi:putative membrane-bound dehydrogenase-like protein
MILGLSFAGLCLAFAAGDATAANEEAPEPFAPAVAAETMIVPEGFHVTLFAGEPDVRQPISFCIDDRGRLWVAEAYNYPFRDKEPQDRVLILEDSDGDGKCDKRTVFYDKLGYVTGIEVGFGGVWIMSPPEMLFIPDKNGDDQPDGPPQVLLDGFGNTTSAHNIANGFTWGPDGWLYAGHGRTSPSDVGPPGTPAEERIHHDGGVYRYHPTRHVFETFCDGTTNPWGVAFDDFGQAIISNCVNPHLFHAIQGGHYEPWRGRPSSQYAFERLPTIADHLHWKGHIREGGDDLLAAGGGHAHCGTMVYLGDNWPDRYRHTVFLGNVHGRRINNDTLERQGSSYTSSHCPDLMIAKDPWFKAVTIQYGPDGSVFVSDWSDTGECHDYTNTHRETGRMFKITYGQLEPQPVDIAAQTSERLVALQLHKNDWHVAHARRVLQQRAAAGDPMGDVHAALHTIFRDNGDVTRKLRALWALFVTGGADEAFLQTQLTHDSEYVRAWAIRLLSEPGQVSPETQEQLADLAAVDPSSFVRLHLASAAIRLSTCQRWPIVEQLVMRGEDADDPFLPLMVWYALEPLVVDDPPRALRVLENTRLARLRPFIARRAASGEGASERVALLAEFLAAERSAAIQQDVLQGVFEALRGRRDLQTPASWPQAYEQLSHAANADVQQLALRVGLLLNDTAAATALRQLARDQNTAANIRRWAIEDLLEQHDGELPPLLFQLLDEETYRAVALRGLARFDHPDTPAEILKRFAALTYNDKQDALATLASRTGFAVALLEAVQQEQLARSEITAAVVRQLQQLNDAALQEKIAGIWGAVGEPSKDALAAINRYKKQLQPDALAAANAARGRAVYAKTCAACHRLFGEGGDVGPEITGANRASVDYLLENILQPSALVPRDYQMTVVATTDGRVVSGLIVEETDAVVKLQTQNEVVIIPLAEIETRKLTPVSMMPEGLLQTLSDEQVRDLIAYLSSSQQVPLEGTEGE